MSIASGNCGSWLSLPVIAPKAWKSIADKYEAQGAADYLPRDTDKTVVAGYKAQQKALAKSMRSRDSATYNFFLRGGYQESSVVYLHPVSRGTVHINRSDPFFSQPVVDYRALSNPTDLEVLLEFTPFTRKYFYETRLKSLDPVELSPGADVTTPDQIATWLREVMIPSSFHPIGTAAMLPKNLGGVVDQDLLVYGVKGLSVVDASVMPDLPGSYTQQTVYAIAEKVGTSPEFWVLLLTITGRGPHQAESVGWGMGVEAAVGCGHEAHGVALLPKELYLMRIRDCLNLSALYSCHCHLYSPRVTHNSYINVIPRLLQRENDCYRRGFESTAKETQHQTEMVVIRGGCAVIADPRHWY